MSFPTIQECPHECKGTCQRPIAIHQNFDAINYEDVSFPEINFDLWSFGDGKRLFVSFMTCGAILTSLIGLALYSF